jgi:lipid-binding SYLF domain-containing protein
MKRELLLALCLVLLLGCFQGVLAGDKAQEKRDAVDRMTQQTLDKLLADDPGARALYDQAAAYAVFDSIKVAVGVTGGGGIGAAVDKATGKHTYMKTGTGGIGLGLGGKSFQIIFLFESEKPFRSFLEKGWQAETSAGATAGTVGKDVSSSFVHGVAIYQLTNKGLIAGADVTGTKFWKAKNLNKE